jgi:ribonuclease HII
MMIAVKKLSPQPQYLLIDGKFEIKTSVPQQAVVKGDARSLSIGAASIVAKVTRDRMMENYDHDYPQFGFARHKGYPTRMHREAIRRFGPCPLHRCTFKGVREYVCRS